MNFLFMALQYKISGLLTLKRSTTLACWVTCILCVTLTTPSCKSSRNISKTVTKQDSVITTIKVNTTTNDDSIKVVQLAYNKLLANAIQYNTLSAKTKIDYNGPGANIPELNVFLRLKKDSIIWANVEFVGITMARIIITKDSIMVLNKKDKNVLLRDFDYLQDVAQIPFDFSTLQDLIVGNLVYFAQPISTYKQNENTTTMLSVTALFKHLVTLNNDNYTILHSKLDDVDANRNRTCDLSYSDYKIIENQQFAQKRNIVISEKSKLTIDIDFKKVTFNETLNYPFTIPNNYKRL